MMRKVLVTGGAGYIGNVLTRQLLARGVGVRVIDCLAYGGKALLPFFSQPRFEFIAGDLRDKHDRKKALEGMDAVVHLAAIVGDPACSKFPDLAEQVNWQASRDLFDDARSAGAQRFVFASTCSNYGKMADSRVAIDETGVLNPVSLYARLKVRCEEYFLEHAGKGPAVSILRFATAYGVSARMRFDLTVNEFARDAAVGGKLVIFGEQFWRPYCHIEDIAAACGSVLAADKRSVSGEVFNVGDSRENYQKKTIAALLQEMLPKLQVSYVARDEDPRDYKVNFEKIKQKLGFSITHTVPGGLRDVIALVRTGIIKDYDSPEYKNS
jgi:nucleoside-diphosphate-sugar epimerase